ncbi:MAG TPA: hypothetical protein VJX16_13440 [Terriglobales bacterium]|nr:hypothetical protein [Terriglobales bacterium]
MDKPAKTAGAHVQTAWPIIFLLGIVVSFSTALYAQETRDHVLTMGKPKEVGMSRPVLKAAVSMYSEPRHAEIFWGQFCSWHDMGKWWCMKPLGFETGRRTSPWRRTRPFKFNR